MTERCRIIVHEHTIIAKGALVNIAVVIQTLSSRTYKSFAWLSTEEEDMASEFVCHALRVLTRSSISVLMVG